MKKKICAWLAMAMLTLSGAAFAQQSGSEVHGTLNLFGHDSEGILTDTLDIDGDGTTEQAFYDYYADTAWPYLQFLPHETLEHSYEAESIMPYLLLTESYYDRWGEERETMPAELSGCLMEPVSVSFLTGNDGVVYACSASTVYGANGWPEEFLEFFRLPEDGLKFEPIFPDQSQLIKTGVDRCENYVAELKCGYVEQLGQWCLLAYQLGENAQGDRQLSLQTCFTLSDGKIQVLARYMDGKRLE